MNICPNCLKPLEIEWNQPGDFLLCLACGEFLTVRDSYALAVALPDELIGATKTRLAVLLKHRCAILKNFCRKDPAEPTNQKHQKERTV